MLPASAALNGYCVVLGRVASSILVMLIESCELELAAGHSASRQLGNFYFLWFPLSYQMRVFLCCLSLLGCTWYIHGSESASRFKPRGSVLVLWCRSGEQRHGGNPLLDMVSCQNVLFSPISWPTFCLFHFIYFFLPGQMAGCRCMH